MGICILETTSQVHAKTQPRTLQRESSLGYPMQQCCPVKMPYCKAQPLSPQWEPLVLFEQDTCTAAWETPGQVELRQGAEV